MAALEKEITGVFVSLRRPLRVVIRRNVGHDRYDVYKFWEKIDAVVKVVRLFLDEIPGFAEKLLAVDEKHYRQSSHRTRHYVHMDKYKIYTRSDLADKYARKVGEIWLDTNTNGAQKLQIVREVCEAADVEYGQPSGIKM